MMEGYVCGCVGDGRLCGWLKCYFSPHDCSETTKYPKLKLVQLQFGGMIISIYFMMIFIDLLSMYSHIKGHF